METRTSFKSVLVLILSAVAIGYFLMWLRNDTKVQLRALSDMVSKPSILPQQAEPQPSPETIVVRALEKIMIEQGASAAPEYKEHEAVLNCFQALIKVVKTPAEQRVVIDANNLCKEFFAQNNNQVWAASNPVERMLAAAVAYASVEPESLAKLLSMHWNNPEYPESERAVLMGILARATYLVDRDSVAGRVSCQAAFDCRMGVALSLKDQTIAFAPTVDGLPRYRIAFVTQEIEAAQGYQMFEYEVFSQNGTVIAVEAAQ